MNSDGFADRLIALRNRIYHRRISHGTSPSKQEMTEGFINNLGTIWHDVNQSIEPGNENGNEIYLDITMVADRLGRGGILHCFYARERSVSQQ